MKTEKYCNQIKKVNGEEVIQGGICNSKHERVSFIEELALPKIVVSTDLSKMGLVDFDNPNSDVYYESCDEDMFISGLSAILYYFATYIEESGSDYYICKKSEEITNAFQLTKTNPDGSSLLIEISDFKGKGNLKVEYYPASKKTLQEQDQMIPIGQELYGFLFEECLLFITDHGNYLSNIRNLFNLIEDVHWKKTSGKLQNQDHTIALLAAGDRIKQYESRLMINDKDKTEMREHLRTHIQFLKQELAEAWITYNVVA